MGKRYHHSFPSVSNIRAVWNGMQLFCLLLSLLPFTFSHYSLPSFNLNVSFIQSQSANEGCFEEDEVALLMGSGWIRSMFASERYLPSPAPTSCAAFCTIHRLPPGRLIMRLLLVSRIYNLTTPVILVPIRFRGRKIPLQRSGI